MTTLIAHRDLAAAALTALRLRRSTHTDADDPAAEEASQAIFEAEAYYAEQVGAPSASDTFNGDDPRSDNHLAELAAALVARGPAEVCAHCADPTRPVARRLYLGNGRAHEACLRCRLPEASEATHCGWCGAPVEANADWRAMRVGALVALGPACPRCLGIA